MLDQVHFGDGVRRLDQPGRSSATGDHDVLQHWPRLDIGQYRLQLQIAVFQRDVQLVKHHQTDAFIGQQLTRHCPGLLRLGDVALAVPGFPR